MLNRLTIKTQVVFLAVFASGIVVLSMILTLTLLSLTGLLGQYSGIVIGFVVVMAFLSVLILWVSRQIATKISSSVSHINDFAFKVNKGDLVSRAQMGKPVNCSSIKQCSTKDCPSYGKAAYCWVEAGSFSNYPACPRALKGEDCRTCEIYKQAVANEFEEMGSALNAVLDELSIKATVARKIAKGDLDQDVHVVSEVDDLGKSLKEMVIKLNQIFNGFKEFANQIAINSDQVSESNQSISAGASQQASSLEEISSSLNLVNGQVEANTKNILNANQLAKKTESAATEGDHQIDTMVIAMNSINESSQKIVRVIKAIDEIAFQTNLLALNAAVEAARAGKYGKGFAVVAEEVRNLAGRSAEAAKETTELIQDSNAKVEKGTSIANNTAQVLKDILKNVSEFAQIINNVAESSDSQSQGISEINKGLEQIEQVIQQNAAYTEQNAASSEELSAQANQLKQLISRFNTAA